MEDLRIASVVFHSTFGRIQENLERMVRWVQKARKEGADVVCFPELNITGYHTSEASWPLSEPIPGPSSEFILKLANTHQITILAGLLEKGENKAVFASHLVASPKGRLGVYRKVHLAPPEHGIFSYPDAIPLFDLAGTCFGVQLCYDAHFPELSTRMANEGAEILIIPHASPRGTPSDKYKSWMRHLTARAFDNGVFIVACNACGENGMGLDFPGLSVVIGPSGEVISKKLCRREGMLIVDLKAADLAAVRHHRMRYFLPNQRFDLGQFKIQRFDL